MPPLDNLPTETPTDTADQITGGRGKPQAGEVVPKLPNGQTEEDVQNKDKTVANQQGKIEEKEKKKDGSLKIHISLDLDVEVHLTARVKGDITIGLL